MKNLYKVILALLFGVSLMTTSTTHAQDTQTDEVLQYRAGDLISLPLRQGNYVMLLWGGIPIWFDSKIEYFTFEPIRNYTTRVYYDVTRQTPTGDYQFVEIDAAGDPRDLNNWRWIRSNSIRIVKCDGFRIC